MGIISRVLDLDKQYQRHVLSGDNTIFVNDYPLNTQENKERFNRVLISEYEGDSISNVPSCTCQKYHASVYAGRKCDNCGDYVLSDLEKPIRPAAWLRPPTKVKKLINPILLTHLDNAFKEKLKNPKRPLLRWFLDPNFHVSDKDARAYFKGVEKQLAQERIPRGINSFYDNFDRVMEILTQLQIKSKPASRKTVPAIVDFIKQHVGYYSDGVEKGYLFTNQLPMQSKAMFIVEKTTSGKFAGDLMIKGIEVAVDFANMDADPMVSQRVTESRCVRALFRLADYHVEDFKQNWASKEGSSTLRNHVYSARTDWSGRAVINSIQDPFAKLDELYIPWSIACVIFEGHLYSKLQSRGYSDADCTKIIKSSTANNASLFKPLLRRIFDELLADCDICEEYGHPALWLRNPSLKRGSSQCMRITKIKDDCNDKTIEMHLLTMPAPNADVNGLRGVRSTAMVG